MFQNLFNRWTAIRSDRYARRKPGSPLDVAEYHAALWQLQAVAATDNDRAEITTDDRLNGLLEESEEFLRANLAVIEAERYVSPWQEWAVRERVAAGVLPEDVRVLLAGE